MKKLLAGLLLALSFVVFSMPVAAAEKSGKGPMDANLRADKAAILKVVSKGRTPKNISITPHIEKIIGNYAEVLLECKGNCESDTAYLMKVNGKWIIKEQGTGICGDDLRKDGFPNHVIKQFGVDEC